MHREYTLVGIADIVRYQEECAKLAEQPGYTDRMAARAAMRLEWRLSDAEGRVAPPRDEWRKSALLGISELVGD